MEIVRSGTFDVVYKAFDEKSGRLLALKLPVVRTRFTTEQQGNFLNLARDLAKLRHSSVVPLVGIGCQDGVPYTGCLFDEAALLRYTCHVPTRLGTAVNLIADLAEVLHFCHDRHGLVHGDINLDNILFYEPSVGQGRVALFSACFSDRAATEFAMSIMPAVARPTEFMSPEQLSTTGHQVDVRSDVYSLGALLVYLTTGKHSRQTEEQSPLDDILSRALAHDPSDRYQSTVSLAEDLRRAFDA